MVTEHSAAWPSALHFSTAQHSLAQASTAQHSTAQHSTAQHSTAQHSTAQHSTAQHSTAQHSIPGHQLGQVDSPGSIKDQSRLALDTGKPAFACNMLLFSHRGSGPSHACMLSHTCMLRTNAKQELPEDECAGSLTKSEKQGGLCACIVTLTLYKQMLQRLPVRVCPCGCCMCQHQL